MHKKTVFDKVKIYVTSICIYYVIKIEGSKVQGLMGEKLEKIFLSVFTIKMKQELLIIFFLRGNKSICRQFLAYVNY